MERMFTKTAVFGGAGMGTAAIALTGAAAATPARTSGTVHVYVTQQNEHPTVDIITGAISDDGTGHGVG